MPLYHGGYSTLSTMVGIVPLLPVYPGGVCWYTPLLVYLLPTHPGYTITRPPSHTGHRWSTAVAPLTALTRTVAEVNISDKPLTVTFPFHCWVSPSTRFTVGLVLPP